MLAGIWTQEQIVRDVFSFQDLVDAHHFLDVREENERIAREWAQKK